MFPQTRIQIVRDVCGRTNHRVSQLDDKPFRVVERCAVIAGHSAQLLVTQDRFSADGRIDINSEKTTDPRGGTDFSQLDVTQRDKSLPAERRFHCDAAPDESWQTHLYFCRRKNLSRTFCASRRRTTADATVCPSSPNPTLEP